MACGLSVAADHDIPVLLTGETGVGKTYLARLIHESSPRRGRPFVTVPCSTLPSGLVESSFFGHVQGAFTGASQDQEGKFAAARDGSILLDEIDALGLEQQAALLRVLEDGEYEPVGSNETRQCKARILAASNQDLGKAVEQGRFRSDLLYRLHVMDFHLPPLRERVPDIDPLARLFIARYAAKFGKQVLELDDKALAVLEDFPWPGNIRELEHIVQLAVMVCAGDTLRLEHLPKSVRGTGPRSRGTGALSRASRGQSCRTSSARSASTAGDSAADSLRSQRQDMERLKIEKVLIEQHYSRTRAAQALGISRMTLYNKMKRYGLLEAMDGQTEEQNLSVAEGRRLLSV